MNFKSLFSAFGPHPEPSTLVAFSQNRLARNSEHRTEKSLGEAFRHEDVHLFAFAKGRLVLKHEQQVLDPLFAPYEIRELEPDFDNSILLGYEENGQPRIAVPVGIDPERNVDHLSFVDGRTLMREALLGEELLGQFAQASALLSWNESARFCGKCGSPTESEIGGYRRRCVSCGTQYFPRTDPVAIMLAVDEENDRCLLGRSPHFPPGMYSCLAGFVEPGETLEDAVRRETREESGIAIGAVRYHASQPWPMPHSLMLGCLAEALSRDLTPDMTELEDCRWFSREEVELMVNGEHPEGITVPVGGAVAFRLVRDWLDWPREP